LQPSYLTHSKVAWASIAVIVLGFAWKFIVTVTGLPIWLMPFGYFAALIASGVLFVGWVRWRAANPARRP
jgi:hypothetical protein